MNPFKRFFAKLADSDKGSENEDSDDITRTAGIYLPANRKLGSCMTHRPDIVWIDSHSTPEEIQAIIDAHPDYTQFPVCSGSVDKVLGVLSVRLFLESLLLPVWPGLRAAVKKAVYLPETVTIVRALRSLDDEACRLAFIIDEYGGVEGMITRNGLVRELLEEARSPTAAGEREAVRRDDGTWLVDGLARMEEIRELFSLPDTDAGSGEYYTLAGYLLTLNGSIPKPGDSIDTGYFRFVIAEMDGNRIDSVIVSPIKEDGDGD